MSAMYGFAASIPFASKLPEAEKAISELESLLQQVNDANLDETVDNDGTTWLEVCCPYGNMTHSFIDALEQVLESVALHVKEGFVVEYRYEDDRAVQKD